MGRAPALLLSAGAYVNENYAWVADVANLSGRQVADLAKQSFEASFLSAAEKMEYWWAPGVHLGRGASFLSAAEKMECCWAHGAGAPRGPGRGEEGLKVEG
jgi:hypothetical protein